MAIVWDELTKLEPNLLIMQQAIENEKDDGRGKWYCANAVWYGYHGYPGYKKWLESLVGHYAKGNNPRVRTSEAYDIAYDTLYKKLPNCRNCGCM